MNLLFICQENTCRSQMAEGFASSLGINCKSAGVICGDGVNPDAITVMNEAGIDISKQYSKSIDDLTLDEFDFVISMCSLDAKSVCPATSIKKAINWNIEDPKGHNLNTYRKVRELIKNKIHDLVLQKEH